MPYASQTIFRVCGTKQTSNKNRDELLPVSDAQLFRPASIPWSSVVASKFVRQNHTVGCLYTVLYTYTGEAHYGWLGLNRQIIYECKIRCQRKSGFLTPIVLPGVKYTQNSVTPLDKSTPVSCIPHAYHGDFPPSLNNQLVLAVSRVMSGDGKLQITSVSHRNRLSIRRSEHEWYKKTKGVCRTTPELVRKMMGGFFSLALPETS